MNLNKIFTAIVVVAILVGGYFYYQYDKKQAPTDQTNNDQNGQTDNTQTPPSTETPTPTPAPADSSDKVVATVETSMGSFQVTLEASAAPKTVANFVKLATDNFCNDTKFHRILKDFVIQGCDPNSRDDDPINDGQGGPGYTVPAELGLKANIGAIGMASTAAKSPSSGSQFFVVTTENANNHAALDNNYTFFGYVTSGMDVVTKIAAVPVEPNVYGEPSVAIQAVTIKKITIKK